MITKNDVWNWLAKHPVATLATTAVDGKPQMATVYTYIDQNHHCYLITTEETRKYKNVQYAPAVALSWFDVIDMKTCEIAGTASIVQSGEEVLAAITHLQELITKQKQGYWIPPVGQLEGGNYAVLRILPDLVRYADYSSTAELDPQPQVLEFTLQ